MKELKEKKLVNRKNRTKPNIVHPVIPGAVGPVESTYREGMDSVEESKMIIQNTIENIIGEKTKP